MSMSPRRAALLYRRAALLYHTLCSLVVPTETGAAARPTEAEQAGNFCWVGGYSYDDCCPDHFGPTGNPQCWAPPFSYARCCDPRMVQLENAYGGKLLTTLESTTYEQLEADLRKSVTSPEARTMSAQFSAIYLVLLLRLRQRFDEAEAVLAEGHMGAELSIDGETGIWRGEASAGWHMHDVALSGELVKFFKHEDKSSSCDMVLVFTCTVTYDVYFQSCVEPPSDSISSKSCLMTMINNLDHNSLEENGVRSVFDFGCGLGLYIKDLRAAGITAGGVDGNPDTITLSNGRCTVGDLSKKLDLGFRYDAVMSFEVAEHIHAGLAEDAFVRNLVRHSGAFSSSGDDEELAGQTGNSPGGILVLSWGNQAGEAHVNNRDSGYVVSRFTDLATENFREPHINFVYDQEASLRLRKAADFGWFKETIHVFRRERGAGTREEL